ncbi:MAG: VOC family protein, partial [Maribacter sp.]|nr:VOC family protein [Maribacter sp.]
DRSPQVPMKKNSIDEVRCFFLPTLSVRRGPKAIEFYKKAFGAVELMRHVSDDGQVVAELSIGDCRFILSDEAPEYDNFSPETLGGTTIRMGLQVEDPDAMAQRAILAGAKEVYAVADQEYGYRLGRLVDPYGHHGEIFKPL